MEITRRSEKEDILAFLKERSERLGHTVLKNEVSKEEKTAVSAVFGSWAQAVKASGLASPNSPQQTALRISQYKAQKELSEQSKANEKNTIWKKD